MSTRDNERDIDPRELRKQMPSWFKQSPVGETILATTAAREAAARKVVADRLAQVRAEEVATLPALKKAAEIALARVESARQALKAAELNHAAASGKHLGRSLELGSAIDGLTAQLRDSAPIEIEDFIHEMSRLYEDNRHHVQMIELRGRRNPIDDSSPVIVHTNLTALTARLAAIREAMATAEALRILPIVPLDLDERLQTLRKEVMSIDVGEVDRSQSGVEWESPTIVDSKGREYVRD